MKILISALIASQLLTAQAPALEVRAEVPQTQQETQTGNTRLKTEQFKWYYRTYKGREQKRLWSLTEEEWVTAWIYC